MSIIRISALGSNRVEARSGAALRLETVTRLRDRWRTEPEEQDAAQPSFSSTRRARSENGTHDRKRTTATRRYR